MPITFECPGCRSRLEVDSDQGELKFRCPSCGADVQSPPPPARLAPPPRRYPLTTALGIGTAALLPLIAGVLLGIFMRGWTDPAQTFFLCAWVLLAVATGISFAWERGQERARPLTRPNRPADPGTQ